MTEHVTPSNWVPFETILCNCGPSGPRATAQIWMFIGVAPYYRALTQGDVQIFIAVNGTNHSSSWASGEYMVNHYHEWDASRCPPAR